MQSSFFKDIIEWLNSFYENNEGLSSLLLIPILGTLSAWLIKNISWKGELSSNSKRRITPHVKEELLKKIETDFVDPLLKDGLRGEVRIQFRLTKSSAFSPVKKNYIKYHNGAILEDEIVQKDIFSIYDEEASGRLLILGAAGTGKTTLTMELVKKLIGESRNSKEAPIPIIFNLANWTSRFAKHKFTQWLLFELQDKYTLDQSTASEIIEEKRVIPILDGLDEVASEIRINCLKKIKEYQQNESFMGQLVLTSRTTEYENLNSNLNIGTSIKISSLSKTEIINEIDKDGLEHVKAAIEKDPELLEIIDTPLWLNVLFLASKYSNFKSDHTDPRRRLFDQYLHYALNRKLPNEHISSKYRVENAELIQWISWIANQMKGRNKVDFAIEDPKFSWLNSFTKKSKRVDLEQLDSIDDWRERFFVVPVYQRILFGTAVGYFGWLFGGIVLGILSFLVAFSKIVGRFEAFQGLEFDWDIAKRNIPKKIIYGTIVGFSFSLISNLGAGLIVGILGILYEFLLSGFRPRSISENSSPNRKTHDSVKWAIIIITIGLSVSFFSDFIGKVLLSHNYITIDTRNIITLASSWFLFAVIVLAGEKGGWFVLRHYSTRLLLWIRGYSPLNYLDFLNECVDRLFLIRHGESFKFIHLTFRDYIADNYKPDDNYTKKRILKSIFPNWYESEGKVLNFIFITCNSVFSKQ